MQKNQQFGVRFAFGEFVLDVGEAALTRSGQPVSLAPKEFELLCALVNHAGRLVYKEDLIQLVWPDTFVSDSSLLRNISVLRGRLGHNAIRTVPKRGYVFMLPVVKLGCAGDIEQPLAPVLSQIGSGSAASAHSASDLGDVSIRPHKVDAPDPLRSWERPNGHPSTLLRRKFGTIFAIAAMALICICGTFLHWRYARASHALVHNLHASDSINPTRAASAVRLFVLNQNGDSISILNTLTDRLTASVLVKGEPCGAATLPDGKAVYVSLCNASNVVVLDPKTSRITAVIPVGNSPVGIAANPRPPFVYVANNYSNSVSVIDATNERVIRTLAVGSVPTEIAVAPDGTRAIVTNQSGGTVTMLDAVANAVLATIPVGATPVGVAFSRDSQFAWVTLAGQDEVAVLDVAAMKVIHRISAGHGPVRVAITRDGRYAIVSDFFSNTLTVIETDTLRPLREIAVGLNPVGLALDAPGDFAYVANYGSNTVSVIDMKTMTVINSFEVGRKPAELAALPCYTMPCR